jgi:hypothetical protein
MRAGTVVSSAPPLLVAMAGGKPRPRRPRVPVAKELSLHIRVADLLRAHCLPDWRWTHIPSGEKRPERAGAKLKAMGVRRGWPDFILVSPYGSVRFLELKRSGGKLTEAQNEFRLWCINHGVPHVVAWTMDQVLAAFDNWGCLRIKA